MSNLMVHTERFTRSRDPETSWDAAVIGSDQWTEILRNVYTIIQDHGPMTHDDVVNQYTIRTLFRGYPKVTPQRIRTAVHSLVLGASRDFDRVTEFPPAVRRHPVDGRSPFGRKAQRWEIVS